MPEAATDYPHLLPPNWTPLEKSLSGASGRLDNAIPVPIDLLLRPWDIPAEFLPWLAWHMGLDLWDWEWGETKRRAVIARAIELHRSKGTAHGLRIHCEIMGSEVIQIVRPPQGFFASPDLSKEEFDSWIKKMPELRIKLAHGTGTAGIDEFFAQGNVPGHPEDFGFSDESAVAIDDGPILYGRRVVLRRNGIETSLQPIRREKITYQGKVVEVERFSLPGKSTYGVFVGDYFSDEAKYVCSAEIEAKIITLRTDSSYEHSRSLLSLTTVFPSLDPMTPRFERQSDIGTAGPFMFSDDAFVGDDQTGFVERDRGAEMLADRIYLHDPTVATPMTEGFSFVGHDRVGMSPFTAEVLIDANMNDPVPSFVVGDSFSEEGFAVNEDLRQLDRAMRAVVTSQAVRDKILVTFDTKRPISATDVINELTHPGDYVANVL